MKKENKDWREEFDRRFEVFTYDKIRIVNVANADWIKEFIRNLLSQKSLEIEKELEARKLSNCQLTYKKDNPQYSLGEVNGFRSGLDSAILIIKKRLI